MKCWIITLGKQFFQHRRFHEWSLEWAAGEPPVRPFNDEPSRRAAAYRRAGLESWADGDVTRDASEQQPRAPHMVLEACLCNVAITLPYGQEPGAAERFTELWAKAFQEVLPVKFVPAPLIAALLLPLPLSHHLHATVIMLMMLKMSCTEI